MNNYPESLNEYNDKKDIRIPSFKSIQIFVSLLDD